MLTRHRSARSTPSGPRPRRGVLHRHHLLIAALVGAALILIPELVMGQNYGDYGANGGGIIYYGNGSVVTSPPPMSQPTYEAPAGPYGYSSAQGLPPCPTTGTVFPLQLQNQTCVDPYGNVYTYGSYSTGYPDGGYYGYYGGAVSYPVYPGSSGNRTHPGSPSGTVSGRPSPGGSSQGSPVQPPKAPNGRPLTGNRVSIPSSIRGASSP